MADSRTAAEGAATHGVKTDASEAEKALAVERCNRGHFIGGEWVAPAGRWIPVHDPSTGEPFADVAYGGEAEVRDAVGAACAAFESWRFSSPAARSSLLAAMADRVEENAEDLAQLEALNGGKPIREARRWDLPMTAEVLRYYAALARTEAGESSSPNSGHLQLVRRRSAGPVGQIIPWNATSLMVAMKVAPAIAAGCPVVLKPSDVVPLPALAMVGLWQEILPAGLINVVTGGVEAGRAIASDPRLRRISFTGSPAVGREVMRAAADNLTPVMLELGGKSPSIVLPDADIEAAVSGAVVGIVPNQGQMCAAGTRLLLHEGIADDFLALLAEQVAGLKIGAALEKETDMGPLVSPAQLGRVTGKIERARSAGFETAFELPVPAGLPKKGNWCPLVCFDRVDPDAEIAREEVFGPVLSVIRWRKESEAVRIANGVATGLAAAVWSRDANQALALLERIDAGVGWINNYGYLPPGLPFGGVKDSGFGRENGPTAIDEYSDPQAVPIRRRGPVTPLY